MEKFRPHDKVKTIRDGKLEKGRIVNVFDELQVAIVTLENDYVAKVPFSQLMIDRDDAEAETKHPGICKRIDREDFEHQLAILTAPENLDMRGVGQILLAIASKILSRKLIDKVFDDKSNVVVNRETLLNAISDVTNPVNVIRKSDSDELRAMSVALCMAVATIFFGLFDHYFRDDSKNA